ncbi:protein-disulfide reductase DsbD domain-containing protein [Mucilaginibacter sp. L196]|uniref:protein-disulfide reductase DsbD domain-containing protein n=1 Tax=Mucilaginibacter sp. L196 TaxID=1641870 RepID=UPI00131E17C2|nr:protein-disulfide reductase DsbD domain-containing protein [Mucilaginibacter sp. L196]
MKKIILVLFSILFIANAFGQILTPVRWSYAIKKLSEKKTMVYVKATIDNGWHIYSTMQPDGGPIKTSFTFSRSKEYTLIGKLTEPKSATKFEPNFKMNVHYFEKSVVFQQKIRVIKNGFVLKGKINFMVCNDEKCLPPENVEFNVQIQ